MTLTEPTTGTLEVPGATLAYDIRRNDASTEPPLFLVGLPMAAPGFATLASHFPDRTIMTYDPRGSERSTKTDPMGSATPDDHAGDLHRLIQELGAGPVDLFGSSGGAITSLALVAKHPEDVRTVVAHEPPLASVIHWPLVQKRAGSREVRRGTARATSSGEADRVRVRAAPSVIASGQE